MEIIAHAIRCKHSQDSSSVRVLRLTGLVQAAYMLHTWARHVAGTSSEDTWRGRLLRICSVGQP